MMWKANGAWETTGTRAAVCDARTTLGVPVDPDVKSTWRDGSRL